MTTVAKAVSRTLRLIGVQSPVQTTKPQDFDTCLEAANSMMARMEADGVSVGWSPISNPSQDLPLSVENEKMFVYNLAMEVAPEFGIQPSQLVSANAAASLSAAYRDVLNANPVINESSGPAPNSGYSGWNTYADGYSWW